MKTITLTGINRTSDEHEEQLIYINIDTTKLPPKFTPLDENKRSLKENLKHTLTNEKKEYIDSIDHHFEFPIQRGLNTGKLELAY